MLYLHGCEVPISIPTLKITSLVGLILCGNSVVRNIGEENSYVIKLERVIHCLLVYVAAKSPSIALVFLITYFLILNSYFSDNILSLGVLQYHHKLAWPTVTFIDTAWTLDIKKWKLSCVLFLQILVFVPIFCLFSKGAGKSKFLLD